MVFIKLRHFLLGEEVKTIDLEEKPKVDYDSIIEEKNKEIEQFKLQVFFQV